MLWMENRYITTLILKLELEKCIKMVIYRNCWKRTMKVGQKCTRYNAKEKNNSNNSIWKTNKAKKSSNIELL